MRTVRPKERTLQVRMTVEDHAELARLAKNERMTVSEYARAAILSYMALRGSRYAWKVAGAGLLATLQERFGTETVVTAVRTERESGR